MFFGNNSCIWIILIIIILLCCGGNGFDGCGRDRFFDRDRCCD